MIFPLFSDFIGPENSGKITDLSSICARQRTSNPADCGDTNGVAGCEGPAEARARRKLARILGPGGACGEITEGALSSIFRKRSSPALTELLGSVPECFSAARNIQVDVWEDKDECRDDLKECKRAAREERYEKCRDQPCRVPAWMLQAECEAQDRVWIPDGLGGGSCLDHHGGDGCPVDNENDCDDLGGVWGATGSCRQ